MLDDDPDPDFDEYDSDSFLRKSLSFCCGTLIIITVGLMILIIISKHIGLSFS